MKFLKYYWYFIGYYLNIQFQRIIFHENSPERKLYDADLYALMLHHSIRQTYDGKPYFYHVKDVATRVCKYKDLIDDKDLYVAYVSALLHDSIEDCNMTYNDVKGYWGKDIADTVYACTELRGRNRKERHGKEYIETLQVSFIGTFVKMCDIQSNIERAKNYGHRMFYTYKKEWKTVKENLYTEEFDVLFTDIEELLK